MTDDDTTGHDSGTTVEEIDRTLATLLGESLSSRRRDEVSLVGSTQASEITDVGSRGLGQAHAADSESPNGAPATEMRVGNASVADVQDDRHAEEVAQAERVDAAINLLNLVDGLVSTIRGDEDNARLSGGLFFAEQGLEDAHEQLTDYRNELEHNDD